VRFDYSLALQAYCFLSFQGNEMSIETTTRLRDEEVIKSFPCHEGAGLPGYFIDFLGVKTRTAYISELPKEGGRVEGYPIPASFHATAIEWAGVLRAVLEADKEIVAVELGAGWAPWLMTVARAAALRGIDSVRLIGVEGCEAHCAYMTTHFSDNGIDPKDHTLLHGVVGTKDGVAEFPHVADPSAGYGAQAIFEDDHEAKVAMSHRTARLVRRLARRMFKAMKAGVRSVRDGTFVRHPGHQGLNGAGNQTARKLKCYSIATLIRPFRKVDLIHVDIQGDEFHVISSAQEILKEKVKRLVIGTHSRMIEQQLLDLLIRPDWELESEEACIFKQFWGRNLLVRDGCQVWRNRAFDPVERG
jgi:FkbM family methyltransferase